MESSEPRRSDATLHSAPLMLRNTESFVMVLGWHWISAFEVSRRWLFSGRAVSMLGHLPVVRLCQGAGLWSPQKTDRRFLSCQRSEDQNYSRSHNKTGKQSSSFILFFFFLQGRWKGCCFCSNPVDQRRSPCNSINLYHYTNLQLKSS